LSGTNLTEKEIIWLSISEPLVGVKMIMYISRKMFRSFW